LEKERKICQNHIKTEKRQKENKLMTIKAILISPAL
jgi:hypothetical protein